MNRLFLTLYLAIFLCTTCVVLVAYWSFDTVNNMRYRAYLKEHFSGTLFLVNRGISRQMGENREKWIALVSQLLDEKIRVTDNRFSTSQIHIHSKDDNSDFVISAPLYEDPNFQVELSGSVLTEQLIATTAFLFLNELGSVDKSVRPAHFETLKAYFPFPVYRLHQQELQLSVKQLQRLNSGEVVIQWDKEFGQGFQIKAIAPWGNSEYVLIMGPIELFNSFPQSIVLVYVVSTLCLIAVIIIAVGGRLKRRLRQIQHTVNSLLPNVALDFSDTASDDALDVLNQKIVVIKSKLAQLIDEQAYMIKAVSHDIRTPIAKIRFRLLEIEEQFNEPNLVVEACYRDLDRLNQLADEILTYEKLNSDVQIDFVTTDLGAILQQVVTDNSMMNREISLSLNLNSTEQCYIYGNQLLLIRLFENLVSNALRYADKEVIISLSCNQHQVKCTIQDDGPGIDNDLLPHIFSPFYNSNKGRNPSQKDSAGGFGFGLAIAKQIVKQHSGKLTAENRLHSSHTSGAIFTITMPIYSVNSNG